MQKKKTDGVSNKDLASYGLIIDQSDLVDFLTRPTKSGDATPIPCHENVLRVIRSFNCVRYNTFSSRYEILLDNTWETRDDHHDVWLHSRMSTKFPFLSTQPLAHVRDAITVLGFENAYDSMQEYLHALSWDGVSRLDSWLHKTYHVEDNEYHKKVGANWFKGLIKRILFPGSKFDFVLILRGPQGIRKSTSLLIIAGEEYHAEFTELNTREFVQDIQGKLVVEFGEGAIFSKADQNTLKSIVSRQKDTYRPPYARASKDFPRRCVFAMTANNDEILKDDTGNRRWWVVLTEKEADTDWLTENRSQLLAEAYHRVAKLQETVFEVPEDVLKEYQEHARTIEQNEDIITEWYRSLAGSVKNNGITIRSVYYGVFQPRDKNGDLLDINTINIDKRTEMSIARSLKYLGLEKRRVQEHDSRERRWYPKEPADESSEIAF